MTKNKFIFAAFYRFFYTLKTTLFNHTPNNTTQTIRYHSDKMSE